MAACCAHHITDTLPILGLTAAAAFLAEYRTAFMLIGLGMTLVGILVMLIILLKEKRKAVQLTALSTVAESDETSFHHFLNSWFLWQLAV
jgi:hypothetical protein